MKTPTALHGKADALEQYLKCTTTTEVSSPRWLIKTSRVAQVACASLMVALTVEVL